MIGMTMRPRKMGDRPRVSVASVAAWLAIDTKGLEVAEVAERRVCGRREDKCEDVGVFVVVLSPELDGTFAESKWWWARFSHGSHGLRKRRWKEENDVVLLHKLLFSDPESVTFSCPNRRL